MRVLLVRAAPVGVARQGIVPPGIVPPIGLLSIMASIRAHRPGDEVRLLDAGLDLAEATDLEHIVRDWQPDVLGLSALSQEAFHVRSLARAARSVLPDLPIIAGGPIANAFPLGVLEHVPEITAAVFGEGEQTVPELLDRLESGHDLSDLAGVAHRENGAAVSGEPRPFIQDLDALPPIDWGDLDIRAYNETMNFAHLPVDPAGCATLITTRGCPYRCSYCHKFFGNRVRAMSPAHVVDLMQQALEQHGIRDFHFVDDIFNFKRGRVLEFCSEIRSRGLDVRYAFPNGLRGDLLSDEEIEAMAGTGLYMTSLAIETVSPRIQKLIHKHLDVDRTFAVAQKLVTQGVLTRAYVMLGFPTETREEMEQTINRMAGSAFQMAMFFPVTPYPGTGLFDTAVEHGFDPVHWVQDRFTYDQDFVNTSTLPDDEFDRLLRSARRRFYTSPGRLETLRAYLEEHDLVDHPYIQGSRVWRMVLESFESGVWSRPAPDEVPPPPPIEPGTALSPAWRVASVTAGRTSHEIHLEGPTPVTVFLSPRDESQPCMTRAGQWNVGIRSDDSLDSLPDDLTRALSALTALLED